MNKQDKIKEYAKKEFLSEDLDETELKILKEDDLYVAM